MKRFLCLLLLLTGLFLAPESRAQFGKLKEKIKQKVDQRINNKTDQAIDKTLDGAENTIEGKNQPSATDNGQSGETGSAKGNAPAQGIRSYSKFDFVPGDRIIYAEDFSQDVVGEFPLKWTTNGSGEVVTIEGLAGKWLKGQESTKYESAFKNKLPENYTIEFDVIFEFKDDQSVPWLRTLVTGDILPGHVYGAKSELVLAPNNGNSEQKDGIYYSSFTQGGDKHLEATKKQTNVFWNANHKNTPVHVAIWIQKQRFRAWLNQEKVYDLPQGISSDAILNHLGFEVTNYGGSQESYQYFISNIKIAQALPDTRSKLITEGKWSTTGILFDVNADKIKPTSYPVLKDIATVLNENPAVKVKIVGHTDSDGDDAKNLDLSKRRAMAVKNALAAEFSVDASRMETDGMGETKPVADNKSAEGKAQNRRVEFIKM